MFKKSPLPVWINILLIFLTLPLITQLYWIYFDQQFLFVAETTTQGISNLNITYTTTGRLVVLMAVTVGLLFTQNITQILITFMLSIFKEGQEIFIDPLFPDSNAGPAAIVIGMHAVIVVLETWAFITVYRIAKERNKSVSISKQISSLLGSKPPQLLFNVHNHTSI